MSKPHSAWNRRLSGYAVLLIVVTTAIAAFIHGRTGYPAYESIMGGLIVGVIVVAAVARRGECLNVWRDLRGK